MDEAQFQNQEQRIAQADETIARLTNPGSGTMSDGTTLTAPVRVVDPSGRLLIELAGDGDGGYVHLCDAAGNLRVTMGCGPTGGCLDVIHAGDERLAVTLFATDDGGRIEITREDGCYVVQGECYYRE